MIASRLVVFLVAVSAALRSAIPAEAQALESANLRRSSILDALPLESKGLAVGVEEPIAVATNVVIERCSQKLPWAYDRAGSKAGWIPLDRLENFRITQLAPKKMAAPCGPPPVAPLPPVETEKLLRRLGERRSVP